MQAFLLSKKVIRAIDAKCKAFLWKGKDSHSRGAKTNWETVCLPKSEGGLGLKLLLDLNNACSLRLIWLLFSGAGSLWIAWVNTYLIKGKNFWSFLHLACAHIHGGKSSS